MVNLSKVSTKRLLREIRRRCRASVVGIVPSDPDENPILLADGDLEVVNQISTAITKYVYDQNRPSLALTKYERN